MISNIKKPHTKSIDRIYEYLEKNKKEHTHRMILLWMSRAFCMAEGVLSHCIVDPWLVIERGWERQNKKFAFVCKEEGIRRKGFVKGSEKEERRPTENRIKFK